MISQDDYDDETKSIWAAYLTMVVNGVALLDEDALPATGETCALNKRLIFEHFANEIDADAWTRNEAKLGELFTIVDGEDDDDDDDNNGTGGDDADYGQRRVNNYVY